MSLKNPFHLFLLVCAFLVPQSGWATTLDKMDFSSMVHSASACVVAKAIKSSSTKINGVLETHTTFEVKDVAFGKTDKFITVVTPGGRITSGKVPMVEITPGAPRFFTGKESLLLIEAASPANTFSVVGFNQGVFSVLDSESGGNVQLPQSLGGNTQVNDALELIRATRSRNAQSPTQQ